MCIVYLLSFLYCCSCQQKQNHVNTTQTVKNDTTKFFQVTQYIQSEIKAVNQTPYFIYRIVITNGKKDSSAINTSVFNQISAQFLTPDINNIQLKKFYTENIFHDQTTKSFTINYSTENKQLEIQNIQVLLQEDGETVKRIFIRKFFNYSDSSAIEQLSWKPGESFEINRLVQKSDNTENSYKTDVVWNQKS